MNDLEATAYGIPYLKESEVAVLHRGEDRHSPANIAVIAAGTGLGEAALIATPSGYFAVASEGGHGDFAPRGAEQYRLLEFLQREFDHVSFERLSRAPACTISIVSWSARRRSGARVAGGSVTYRRPFGRDRRDRNRRARRSLRPRPRTLHRDLRRRGG